MVAVQRMDTIDRMNQRQNRCFYTSYSEMNEVLNRFATEAEADDIWVSAEVQELKENRSGKRLCQIVNAPKRTLHQNPMQGYSRADAY